MCPKCPLQNPDLDSQSKLYFELKNIISSLFSMLQSVVKIYQVEFELFTLSSQFYYFSLNSDAPQNGYMEL